MQARILILVFACACGFASLFAAFGQSPLASWQGLLRDAVGKPLAGVVVELREARVVEAEGSPAPACRGLRRLPVQKFASITDPSGAFAFQDLTPGTYSLSVRWQGRTATLQTSLHFGQGERLEAWLQLFAEQGQVFVHAGAAPGFSPAGAALKGRAPGGQEAAGLRPGAQAAGGATPASSGAGAQASGGERLSSREVSGLPLNKRDFSQLLLLAAGTMTDTNGAANFTQQFAVNGLRGTNAVFAMDGIYATDPELGGATFANFNVDAIQEIQSSSGVMPPEIGQGAAGFTNVVTKSGTDQVHGAVFEFVRNASLDARNFFDRRTIANPGRIPPFARNEFGFTNGGPVVLPGLYNGRKRSYYFGQYQSFRQVLGTTQVFPVPTPEERQGKDTTAFPGDTLLVPVSSMIAPVLARYPLPNDPQGAYGARTFATSSKVSTTSDQFSVRIDHNISDQARLFARFNFNNVTGPTTNPSQIAIDPSFAMRFLDHQRNFGLTYTRAVSPHFTSESSIGFLRSTPLFPTINRIQPALRFGDGLYEPFNSAAGSVLGSFGNLFQGRHSFTYVRGAHTFKMGVEARFNRDTTVFGFEANGQYTFGGGPAYAPVEIPSVSGMHDIHVGEPLPDALTGFLTATPYSYTAEMAAPQFAQGDHIGESAVRREAYNFYFQDTWKISPRFVLNYGLRYEVNTRIHEAKHRTSVPVLVGPGGQRARFWDPGARQKFLFDPQPPYDMDWKGWGPRLAIEWQFSGHTILRAGGAMATILPDLLNDNFLTGGIPFVFNPYFSAAPGTPVPFANATARFNFPPVLTPAGQTVFLTGRTTDVPPNTEIDLQRFEEDLAAVTPGRQIQPLVIFGMSRDFRNGYIGTYTAGLEHDFGDIKFSASYVATAGVKLASILFPNSYGGAEPPFAPFTRFDERGNVRGGFGPEYFMSNRSHSTFHSLQAALTKTSARAGLGFQASYTFSKSLDDTSAVFGGLFGSSSGNQVVVFPQNPWNPGADKGRSTFDVTHILTISLIQALPLDRVASLRPLGRRFTSGWQFLNISSLTSGLPFSVYSGVQQTGAGSNNADRPDQIGQPVFSSDRAVREDYFGQGTSNTAFFSIPLGVPGGTGPNHGRFGTLGRNTFRGPAFHSFDVALIKDTAFGRRGSGEVATLEFRAEFFNVFNLVNFGLPANIVRGSGFGLINRTAGPSRQLQFSLKLIY